MKTKRVLMINLETGESYEKAKDLIPLSGKPNKFKPNLKKSESSEMPNSFGTMRVFSVKSKSKSWWDNSLKEINRINRKTDNFTRRAVKINL